MLSTTTMTTRVTQFTMRNLREHRMDTGLGVPTFLNTGGAGVVGVPVDFLPRMTDLLADNLFTDGVPTVEDCVANPMAGLDVHRFKSAVAREFMGEFRVDDLTPVIDQEGDLLVGLEAADYLCVCVVASVVVMFREVRDRIIMLDGE